MGRSAKGGKNRPIFMEVSIHMTNMTSVHLGEQQSSFLSRISTLLRKIWKGRVAYLFVIPMFVFYLIYVFYPFVRTAMLMFMNFEFLRPDRNAFVGLDNIIQWVQDPRVPETFWNSIKFFLLYVPTSIIFALIVALVLDRVSRTFLATTYRTIYYLPVVLPASIIFIIWTWIYDPQWGVMNTLLIEVLGINWPWPMWLRDPTTSLASLALMSVWRLMGVTMILFLVGLSGISQELREAAKIDGANEWQVVRFLELPLLRPIFLIVLIMRLQVLGLVEEPLVMTNGGPLRSTMTYGLQAYYISFRDNNWDMGYGSTWFILLGLLSTVTAFVSWRLMRQEELT
jgi:ABC-type sugar transport system permease subunit